jgi:hypothetical protein
MEKAALTFMCGQAGNDAALGYAGSTRPKPLSPRRLELWAFQRNTNARDFYESQGFHAVQCTDGRNEENEPDVKYEWERARRTS